MARDPLIERRQQPRNRRKSGGMLGLQPRLPSPVLRLLDFLQCSLYPVEPLRDALQRRRVGEPDVGVGAEGIARYESYPGVFEQIGGEVGGVSDPLPVCALSV